jgi:putative transposase
VTELKNRGVSDIYIACVDGLKGFPEAIEAVFPDTQVQTCIAHMVRHSPAYVSHKDRKEVAEDLKAIYQAATLEEAERQLEGFARKWDDHYPLIAKSWRASWARATPMFGYPADMRRAVYTTNAIESLHMTLRKIIKNRSLFPSDEAVFKLLYLSLKNISKKWTMPRYGPLKRNRKESRGPYSAGSRPLMKTRACLSPSSSRLAPSTRSMLPSLKPTT